MHQLFMKDTYRPSKNNLLEVDKFVKNCLTKYNKRDTVYYDSLPCIHYKYKENGSPVINNGQITNLLNIDDNFNLAIGVSASTYEGIDCDCEESVSNRKINNFIYPMQNMISKRSIGDIEVIFY